jgi:trigger factor
MMKVNVEDISGVKKKVHVEIPEDQVTKEIDAIYEDLKKTAKIKGFRPGKVPRPILERYFKDYVKGEALQKLIQGTYPKAFEDSHLHPVSTPVIDPQGLEFGKPFQYSAIIEIRPDLKMENYLGLNIEGKREEAKDEEVEERLKGLQNLYANLKTITEPRPIQNGDFVIVDYEARMNGKALEEGKAIDYTVEVGSGRFIPAFEEKLIGVKPEEEKEIEVFFPEDYGYKKWAGKTITFHVKVKEIKKKILPTLDDEFAKDLGSYASLEELKARLRQDLEKEKKLALDRQFKDQIVDQLIQANPFELPESLVEEQAKSLVSDTKLRLSSQGVAFESLGVSEDKLKEDYKETAQKQVRTFLILEKISEEEGITVTDEEVEERLKEISERTHQKLDVVKRYHEKNGLIPEVKAGILSHKTLNLLLEKANITYR